jgi:hypothetical protein
MTNIFFLSLINKCRLSKTRLSNDTYLEMDGIHDNDKHRQSLISHSTQILARIVFGLDKFHEVFYNAQYYLTSSMVL